jgi:hypothetical protein
MANLLFRLEYTVRELWLPPEVVLDFAFGGPHAIRVILRAPDSEAQAIGHNAMHAFCTASSVVEPNPNVSDVFSKIASNLIVPKDADNTHAGATEYPMPDGSRIRIPALSRFPEHFRSFVTSVSDELRDFAIRTVSVLRWRANQQGPHNPISTRGLHWSVDGSFWHHAPSDVFGRGFAFVPMRVPEAMRDEVQNIVNTGNREPLHHDLFREAWEQRFPNPRSALMIGMAAAELSVKHCVSILVPDAEWLTSNLPTPPLVRMLIEYIPKLPARFTFDGKVKPPPSNVLDSLKKGVTIRNGLAHAGASNPSVETVEAILQAVHDLLCIMDFYSGFEWALDFLGDETKSSLIPARCGGPTNIIDAKPRSYPGD